MTVQTCSKQIVGIELYLDIFLIATRYTYQRYGLNAEWSLRKERGGGGVEPRNDRCFPQRRIIEGCGDLGWKKNLFPYLILMKHSGALSKLTSLKFTWRPPLELRYAGQSFAAGKYWKGAIFNAIDSFMLIELVSLGVSQRGRSKKVWVPHKSCSKYPNSSKKYIIEYRIDILNTATLNIKYLSFFFQFGITLIIRYFIRHSDVKR